MAKKCIICRCEAKYKIKDSSEFYCEECAKEHFADTSYLQRVEDAANELKKIIDEDIREE